MGPDEKKLARIHRVRTLQLGLARAAEVAAEHKVGNEAALSARIHQLTLAVSPTVSGADAAALHAAAHFRDRLHQSAAAAAQRVTLAEQAHARAVEATRAAKRDQTAVEKLLERAGQDAQRREMRALEDAPQPVPHRFRHDPC